MSVGAQPKQYEIKARELARFQVEELLNRLFVIAGRGIRIFFFGKDAENLIAENFRKQSRFVHHAIVAVRMVRGHEAFVAEEEENFIPRDVGNGPASQQRVQTFWRRAP